MSHLTLHLSIPIPNSLTHSFPPQLCVCVCYANFRLDDRKIKLDNGIYLKMDDPILFLALELYRLPKALVYLFLAYFFDCKLEKKPQYLIEFQWLICARLFHWLSLSLSVFLPIFFYSDVLWCYCFVLFLLLERSRIFYLFNFLLLCFFHRFISYCCCCCC